ncbi:MAG TPA: alkaline phosphatase family protein, partial [Ktedonobacteraceae bacterium]|nr:alkaline phosphatase family protein [Ktedonobacteraceae bacterium]
SRQNVFRCAGGGKMRVFLFGVDGLTFRILCPLIERGLLPNFQKLQELGVQGILRSTVPPLTPPAWMSIATGMSPARHGIYDFWHYEQTEHSLQAHVATHRLDGMTVWQAISAWGLGSIIANVPLTYPAEPFNGIMISGYMAPGMHARVTYPASFKEELLQAVPNYQIDLDPAVESEQIGNPLVATLQMTREHIALLRFLMEKPWDFFFIVFTGADRIQHVRWQQVVAFHPQAVAYYQLLDEALGMVLDELNPEDLLLVVSDHGFQGAQRQFYIQEYLRKKGLLFVRHRNALRHTQFQNRLAGLIRKPIWAIGLQGFPTLLRRQLYRYGMKAIATSPVAAKIPDLDWANTSAWVPSASGDVAGYADIFLDNTMTEGQINALLADLRAIRDPVTGQALLAEAYREDVFGSGPFAPKERHLVLIANENTALRVELGHSNLWDTCRPYGIHHPDGVLYLYGAGTKRGVTIAPTHVYDVVPTIFSAMGLPSYPGLEGRVIEEAFERLPAPFSSPSHRGSVMSKLTRLASHSPD